MSCGSQRAAAWVRAQPMEALTHRGWDSLRPGDAPLEPRGASWRKALEKDGRLADEDSARAVLCVSTWQSTLELWDTHADVLLWSKAGTKPVRVAAAPDGCVVLSESGALEYLDRLGARSMMDEHATAFSLDGQTLAMASDYCAVLREVWQEVPMVWQNGRAVEKPPPPEHRCNRVPGLP